MNAPNSNIIIPRPTRRCPPPPHCHEGNKIINNIIIGDQSASESVLSAIQEINNRLFEVDEILATLSANALTLGETEGTAYPGDKGLSTALALDMLRDVVVLKDELTQTLMSYATTEALSVSIDGIRSTIDDEVARLNTRIDEITIGDVSGVISAVVSSMIDTMSPDYSEIQQKIDEFQNDF